MKLLRSFTAILTLAAVCGAIFNLDASPQLEELKAGNLRFVNHKPQKCNLNFEPTPAQVGTQNPIAVILACSDSRVSPEIIFDQSNGDLFVVRLAGNTIDNLALGSIEYAETYLKTPLLVILGHQNCGAVEATFKLGDKSFSPNIEELLHQIYPAVEAAKKKYGDSSNKEMYDYAIRENVHHTHKEILLRSPTIKKGLENKTFEIVEAVFSIETGKVEWLPVHTLK